MKGVCFDWASLSLIITGILSCAEQSLCEIGLSSSRCLVRKAWVPGVSLGDVCGTWRGFLCIYLCSVTFGACPVYCCIMCVVVRFFHGLVDCGWSRNAPPLVYSSCFVTGDVCPCGGPDIGCGNPRHPGLYRSMPSESVIRVYYARDLGKGLNLQVLLISLLLFEG